MVWNFSALGVLWPRMKVLITAGPTVEPIDPVRYLTNRSSGKMGYALAAAAVENNALGKCLRKKCDLVVANDVSRKDIGFDSSENEVTLVYPDRSEALPQDSKEHLAYHLMEVIEEL